MKRKATRQVPKKSAAVLTIKDAAKMTDSGRHAVSLWLRRQASMLDRLGDQYSGRFTARYLYW